MSYPILVENLVGDKALTIVCEGCHAEDVITDDDILSDGYYRCPKRCGSGHAVYKYEFGQKCKGCGRMDFSMPDSLAGCCSRKCMLQAEYAETLRGAA